MKKLFPFAAVALLGSCSLPLPWIEAKIVGSEVVFEAFESANWPWQSPKPIPMSVDRFSVFSREGATWVIERSKDAKCRAEPRPSTFPLTYGRIPACFVERLHASPLRIGVDYRVEYGADYGNSGEFRLGLTIDKARTEGDLANRADGWPMETHPNSVYPMDPGPPDPENSIIVTGADDNISSGNLAIETPPE